MASPPFAIVYSEEVGEELGMELDMLSTPHLLSALDSPPRVLYGIRCFTDAVVPPTEGDDAQKPCRRTFRSTARCSLDTE